MQGLFKKIDARIGRVVIVRRLSALAAEGCFVVSVVHEKCSLPHFDHAVVFWRLAMSLTPDARRHRVVEFVSERAKASVDDLAHALGVSRETIRRDLAALDRRGLVRKFHGGAMTPESGLDSWRNEGPFNARMLEHTDEKRAIARRAALLFQPGEALFIDSGTTTVMFAEELSRRDGLNLITNSLLVAQAISRGPGNNAIFVLGGRYRDEAGENLGPLAIEQIGRFQATHAVLTVGALDEAGVMDFDQEEAAIARAMIAQASRITVLVDSSKFMRTGLFRVCALEKIDRIVTDCAPEVKLLEALSNAGVEIVLAAPHAAP